ncbi:hypothetical protein [Rudaeicoccus suwonensis]|uniref:Uncharacterized protein n=1 Tax=Rudaeicoccus suwonensis TaxID=657409 RepID=A0A561E9W1_9MICO|nr:hypothetical protein [Rudaeicoccus suwonensis]TWE12391.1 hypothetical protein BKA23_1194 [Rudaeicoccus suwonensis]
MALFKARTASLPADVEHALALSRGERVLAFGVDDNSGQFVVATTFRLLAVGDNTLRLDRPWHLVDVGQWQSETFTLTVTWVDHARGDQWTFARQATRLPEAFRERVQASVVLSEPLPLTGPRAKGRVVIRRELSTGELLAQTVLGRSTRGDDPQVQAAVERLTADLKEQVGL